MILEPPTKSPARRGTPPPGAPALSATIDAREQRPLEPSGRVTDTGAARPSTPARSHRIGRVYGLIISDVLMILVAYAIGVGIVVGTPTGGDAVLLAGEALLTLPVWFVVFAANGLFQGERSRLVVSTLDEAVSGLTAILAAGFVVAIMAALAPNPVLDTRGSLMVVAVSAIVAAVLVPTGRSLTRSLVLPAIDPRRRAVIVGSGTVADLVHRKMTTNPELGFEVVGFVDDDGNPVPGEVLGRPDEIVRICEQYAIDHVVIAFQSGGHEELLGLVRSVRSPNLQVSIVPRAFEGFTAHSTLDDLAGLPVVTLPPARPGRAMRVTKRAFDLVVAGIALLVAAPVIAGLAIAVRLDSRGPAFFRQARRGRGGGEFAIVKLRTMHVDAEARRRELADRNEVDGALFKMKEDPRITRIGRFLRRTSLDELPQLWNVVRGEMSLVGPRPFVLQEADEIDGWAARRTEATPGITGLWQTLGRNDLPYDEMLRLDYLYTTNWSLGLDLKILFKTIPTVLRKRGAY